MRNGFFIYIVITVFLMILFGIGFNKGIMRSIFGAFQLRDISDNTSPGSR
ncbi:hypothetical protein [Tumebacillus permanentifrigoris]|uniref:Uncharacterized protein n=1 Tax=Tumebacillus permanentifrigoris TaxID=378543 RepID=A0A316DTP5_9BACL|nr:hypothetical protein [Tumebacillus permanentifrigoris]PWK11261.1 hypothetical protein C7459_11154 [Tumebacillus permanentifrigoris]